MNFADFCQILYVQRSLVSYPHFCINFVSESLNVKKKRSRKWLLQRVKDLGSGRFLFKYSRYIFIIMEYCEHGDLSCFIRKRRKLPEVTCRKFLQQLALALKFLRSHNVCHMDLKPQNLLLTSTPRLMLKLAGKYTV